MPKLAWQALVGLVVLLVGFGVVRCYGGSNYDRGRREAELAHTDSVRKAVTAALDSADKKMVPVLEALVRENDSLKETSRQARISAANALGRAARAESRLKDLSPDDLANTPPEVRLLIDSLALSVDTLRLNLEHMVLVSRREERIADSLAAIAGNWHTQYLDARAALDTAAKEISQLQHLKQPKPKRFGFKSGVVTGVVATLGAIIAATRLVR